ncbi:IclR family transcriptional regulator [Bacillus dakarensis]|uniref:IclR family transcriptional regulator n=1 Tax=Robertmurraya dakarensis TaxID=1926278 RepID=UPI0009824605|nr:IclR family transcriptional regulator [Bacillus dakarensis]
MELEVEQKNPDVLSTVERALRVLSIFNEQRNEYSLHEISVKLGIPKTMAFRTLLTLETMGYVKKNEKDKTYSLGYEVFRLGKLVEKDFSLTKIVQPILQELNHVTEETVCLVIPDKKLHRAVQILSIETKHPIKHNSNMVTVGFLHCGAARKTILAHMEEEFIDQVIQETGLPKISDNTITDPIELRKELVNIKEKGYAISKGEALKDVFSAAAPIFNYTGEIVGSIGVYLPMYRLNDNNNNEAKFIELIKRYSSKISDELLLYKS